MQVLGWLLDHVAGGVIVAAVVGWFHQRQNAWLRGLTDQQTGQITEAAREITEEQTAELRRPRPRKVTGKPPEGKP